MRQRHGDSSAYAQGRAHFSQEQIAFVPRETSPLYSLPALRGHDQMVPDQRHQELQTFVAVHTVNSPVKTNATGSRRAFMVRTALLILVSRLSPFSMMRYSISSASSWGINRLPGSE